MCVCGCVSKSAYTSFRVLHGPDNCQEEHCWETVVVGNPAEEKLAEEILVPEVDEIGHLSEAGWECCGIHC